MVKNIVFTTTMSDNAQNSSYSYQFPSQFTVPPGSKIALANLTMNYSVFNITAALGNNTFSYIWNGAVPTTNVVTIPDGFYTVDDLNLYLEQTMILNTHYLINAAGEYVYYLNMQTNSVRYAVQLNETPIPNALPAGWAYPSGATWTVPAVASTPQFVFASGSGILTNIGFAAGSYPSSVQSSTQSQISSTVPQITATQAFLLRCNMINDSASSILANILYSFAPNATIGSQISVLPPSFAWIDAVPGSYQKMTLSFVDQNNNIITNQDPTFQATVLLDTPFVK